MKIKQSKSGIITMTAESKRDSLNLLKFLEREAGRENDPDRASLKREKELEAELAVEQKLSDERRIAYKEALFINKGSVWDIECHLKCYGHNYSIAQLMAESNREIITRNRKTVIKKITALIKKMEKIKPATP